MGLSWRTGCPCPASAAPRYRGTEGSSAERLVHVRQTLCCWIKCQLNRLNSLILRRERRVSRLYFAKQLEKGLYFLTVIVLLQGDVVAVDSIRHLPSCCQRPLSCRFCAMGGLTRSALHALAQEPKAQGLSTIFSCAASHSVRGQAWLPGGLAGSLVFHLEQQGRQLSFRSPTVFKL